MLYTKIQPQSFLLSGEEASYVFLLYMGMAAMTVTICTNFKSPFNRRFNMKFEENWSKGFRGEVVQRCGWTTDSNWSQQLMLSLAQVS